MLIKRVTVGSNCGKGGEGGKEGRREGDDPKGKK
jgi:hypothetical protein